MAAAPAVIRYYETNPQGWVFQEPRKNPKNGLNVYIQESKNSRATPRFELERCRVPFGVQNGMEETSRKNVELAVGNPRLLDWCRAVHAVIVDYATTNSLILFKKQMSRELVSETCRSLISTPSKETYEPLLRVKINDKGHHKTNVYVIVTVNGEQQFRDGDLTDIREGSEIIPIVEVGGIWVVSKGCGLTLVATDIVVFPQATRGKFDFNPASFGGKLPSRCSASTVASISGGGAGAAAGMTHVPEASSGGRKEDDQMEDDESGGGWKAQ